MTINNQDNGLERPHIPSSSSPSINEVGGITNLLASSGGASQSSPASYYVPPPGPSSVDTSRSPRYWFKNATRPSSWLPSPGATTAAGALPRSSRLVAHLLSFKTILVTTVALYALNQMALLPVSLSSVVSKVLFWPTLPITVVRRLGRWTTIIDDTVIMGGAPFGFAGLPRRLHDQYGVRGVINLCEEYRGPIRQYDDLGMTQLWLPSIDHYCPNVEALEAAVHFIGKHHEVGQKVYVHCRAGHGRSAAAVYCWLLSRQPNTDRKALNEHFRSIRNVKSGLWKEPAIVEFHNRLLQNFTAAASASTIDDKETEEGSADGDL